jgi:AcrR family transcriptional regulator
MMSKNSGKRRVRASSVDARARRTRLALAEALMTLAPRVGADRVDVRRLVATAGVGRSTFYKHYADKDDFFITSFAGMIAMFDARAREARPDYDTMLPAREVFAHVEGARAFALSLASSGSSRARRRVRTNFAVAEANLRRCYPAWPNARRQEMAVVLASAFAGLMRWWIEAGLRQSASHVADLYESVARRVLAADAAPVIPSHPAHQISVIPHKRGDSRARCGTQETGLRCSVRRVRARSPGSVSAEQHFVLHRAQDDRRFLCEMTILLRLESA